MSEETVHTCIKIWRILPICIGDKVEVYPRGMRSMIMIRGIVRSISESAILIETSTGELLAIRLNEIRMINKIKDEVSKK